MNNVHEQRKRIGFKNTVLCSACDLISKRRKKEKIRDRQKKQLIRHGKTENVQSV